MGIYDPGLISRKAHEPALTFKPARNPPAIKWDNSQSQHHQCLNNIQKQGSKSAPALGRQLWASLHKPCWSVYSVSTVCSHNGYIKQLFSTGPLFKEKELSRDSRGMYWERVAMYRFYPWLPPKHLLLLLHIVTCARRAHNVLEMLKLFRVPHFFGLNATTNMLILITPLLGLITQQARYLKILAVKL